MQKGQIYPVEKEETLVASNNDYDDFHLYFTAQRKDTGTHYTCSGNKL